MKKSRIKRLILSNRGLLATIALSTVLVFLWSFVSFTYFLRGPLLFVDRIMNHYDVERFVWVAEHGYGNVGNNPPLIAALPLFPLVSGILGFLINNYLLASFIIANIFFIVSCLVLYFLTRIDFNKKIALNAVLFFSIFPTVYFLHTGYSDAMFIGITISSFYFSRKSKWLYAGVTGMFSSLTKIFGILLLPALAIEYLHQKNFKFADIKKDFLFLLLVGVGFIIYLILNYSLFGNPFEFIKIQDTFWDRKPSPAWVGLGNALKGLSGSPYESLYSISEAVFGLLGFLASALVFFKIRYSYGIFMILALASVTFNTNWIGTPRYVLTLFPMFILIAKYVTNRGWLKYSFISVFIVFLMVYLELFATGRWAF